MNRELFYSRLKKHGLSSTKARRTIFDILDSEHQAMTMRQLVNAAAPSLDRSTVYRIVDLFETIGIVTKVYTGWKYRVELSDGFNSHHHHITCISCGDVVNFHESTELESMLESIAAAKDFKLQSHSLELRGICRTCQNRS